MTARAVATYVNAVQKAVEPLVDLLVLINDCSPLLGGSLAAQLDTLVRGRIVAIVDEAALTEAGCAIEIGGVG